MCGAINVDLLATADHKPLPDDSTPGRLRRCAGGVGRNIAENLVRLGIDVTLISAVGDDDFGRRIVERDKQTGVDVSQIQVSPDWPTASYTAIHGPDGELLHAVSDMRLFDQFSLPVSPDFSTRYNSTDLLVIDANLPESVIKTLAQSYHPKFIAAEAVSRNKCLRLSSVLPLLSLLKVNRAEACALTGCTADDERLLESLLELGPAQVLLTTGEEGALLASKTNTVHAVPVSAAVVSTNGVGDAMFSGVLAAHLYGYTAEKQLQWGTTASIETLGVHSACATSLNVQTMGQ